MIRHKIEVQRSQVQTSMVMHDLMHEIFVYLVILGMIWTISFGNRDPQAYQITDLMHKTLLDGGFLKVSNHTHIARSGLYTGVVTR